MHHSSGWRNSSSRYSVEQFRLHLNHPSRTPIEIYHQYCLVFILFPFSLLHQSVTMVYMSALNSDTYRNFRFLSFFSFFVLSCVCFMVFVYSVRLWGWQGRLAIGALGINQDPDGVLSIWHLHLLTTNDLANETWLRNGFSRIYEPRLSIALISYYVLEIQILSSYLVFYHLILYMLYRSRVVSSFGSYLSCNYPDWFTHSSGLPKYILGRTTF